jgi:hypothetical protein
MSFHAIEGRDNGAIPVRIAESRWKPHVLKKPMAIRRLLPTNCFEPIKILLHSNSSKNGIRGRSELFEKSFSPQTHSPLFN